MPITTPRTHLQKSQVLQELQQPKHPRYQKLGHRLFSGSHKGFLLNGGKGVPVVYRAVLGFGLTIPFVLKVVLSEGLFGLTRSTVEVQSMTNADKILLLFKKLNAFLTAMSSSSPSIKSLNSTAIITRFYAYAVILYCIVSYRIVLYDTHRIHRVKAPDQSHGQQLETSRRATISAKSHPSFVAKGSKTEKLNALHNVLVNVHCQRSAAGIFGHHSR